MFDYLSDAENDIKTYFETHDIPKYFYHCLFGELVKVFGVKFLIPDENYLAEYDEDGNIMPSNNDDYSYKDQIAYFLTCECGTYGWHMAFNESCRQCDMMSLYEDYRLLDWVRGDYFDGYIADKMVEVLFDEETSSDYYLFKFKKEGDNETN